MRIVILDKLANPIADRSGGSKLFTRHDFHDGKIVTPSKSHSKYLAKTIIERKQNRRRQQDSIAGLEFFILAGTQWRAFRSDIRFRCCS